MKIYLASRYSRREELCRYRSELEALGHSVTSRWLNGEHQIDSTGQPIGEHGEALVEGTLLSEHEVSARADALRTHFVTEDCADVEAADCVVSFTEAPRSAVGNRGGRHVEFGMAIAWGKRLIVVGYRENLFHYLPQVSFCTTWSEAKEVINTPLTKRKTIGHLAPFMLIKKKPDGTCPACATKHDPSQPHNAADERFLAHCDHGEGNRRRGGLTHNTMSENQALTQTPQAVAPPTPRKQELETVRAASEFYEQQ